MSFILDALKKSENERQRKTGPSLADVRTGSPDQGRPPWLILGIAVVAINLLVILAVLLWPEGKAPEPQAAITTPDAKGSSAATPRPTPPPPLVAAPQVPTSPPVSSAAPAIRPEVRSLAAESARPVQAPSAEAPAPAPATVNTTPPVSSEANSSAGTVVDDTVPTLNELIVDGRINLPSLHVDIHVYSAESENRFVFVNNRKYREGDQLNEGPRVEEISTQGVILNHRGQRFLLPRD